MFGDDVPCSLSKRTHIQMLTHLSRENSFVKESCYPMVGSVVRKRVENGSQTFGSEIPGIVDLVFSIIIFGANISANCRQPAASSTR